VLALNDLTEERTRAQEFMGRMPYTFLNAETNPEFVKATGLDVEGNKLLDRNGHVLYEPMPTSAAWVAPTAHLLKMLLAYDAQKASH
jgi:hypothetical protein